LNETLTLFAFNLDDPTRSSPKNCGHYAPLASIKAMALALLLTYSSTNQRYHRLPSLVLDINLLTPMEIASVSSHDSECAKD
jgi:hypothetical protein